MTDLPMYVLTGNKIVLDRVKSNDENFRNVYLQLRHVLGNQVAVKMLDKIKVSQTDQKFYEAAIVDTKANGFAKTNLDAYFNNSAKFSSNNNTLSQLNNLVDYLTHVYNDDSHRYNVFSHQIIRANALKI